METTRPDNSWWAGIVTPISLLVVICATAMLAHGVAAEEIPFGPPSHGLVCRIATVSPASDDESPDFSSPMREFDRATDVTFVMELKNVGDQPVTLLGVRYGDSYPTAKGKLNTRFLGPHLFDLEFSDAGGQPIQRAERFFVRNMLTLHGASAHEVAAGESLRIMIRPAKFIEPMNHVLPPGTYRARLRYHGPDQETRDAIAKHWPDKPNATAWPHEVTSNEVKFAIGAAFDGAGAPDLVWGPENDGLQAAIELRIPDYVVEDPFTAPGIPVKTNVGVVFHVKNISDKPITFVSETGRQGDTPIVHDAKGEKVNVGTAWFSGMPIDVRWKLKPGEVANLNVLSPGLASITQPGQYTLRYNIRFNGRISKDADGNQIFPAPDDWQDVLTTGTVPFVLRTRTIEDDDRAKPPHFVGKIQFVGEHGDPVDSGSFTYRGEIKHKYHTNRLLKTGSITIPDCTTRPAMISVRAGGFEEARFHDVKFAEGETTILKLKRANPVRFRLLHSVSRSPIAKAKVRFFNKTSANAGGGPYPTDELEGPVWATSGADGSVLLTSLQRVDPYYEKLGAATYFFYIEPDDAALAPRFIGPVKAGQDLGDITLGPVLKVTGEVHGTPQQLDRFAAEWDQPFEQQTDNPAATWLYANSQRLTTQRDGDKLIFELTNLRPGKLRIISNFGPRPHSVKHVYGRREVGEHDVLLEIDLHNPSTDVVVRPK
jgi:hypothetical protein